MKDEYSGVRRVRNILMILQSDYPPDIRLTKEIKILTENGYHVYLLSNNKKGLPRLEEVDGATVIRLRYYPRWAKAFNPIVNVPLFFNPVWLWAIMRAIIVYRIRIVHVHDLPLALAAIWVARMFCLPVIFDVHENYPAALRIWGRKGFLSVLFRSPMLAEKLESICLSKANAIIVVAEEHRNLFLSRGLSADKVFVVGNTVDYEQYTSMEIDLGIVSAYEHYFALVYVGKFGPERDLETAICALPLLKDEFSTVRLLLVGDGPNMADLQKMAAQKGVIENVEFIGWVDFRLTPTYIKAGKICIIPQPANDLIDHGVPHKLFQYMAMGKPIVCSDSKALSRIVRECQCGEIFTSHSPQSFAEAVIKIAHSQKKYGQRGKEAIERKYNWARSSQELLRVYAKITSSEQN